MKKNRVYLVAKIKATERELSLAGLELDWDNVWVKVVSDVKKQILSRGGISFAGNKLSEKRGDKLENYYTVDIDLERNKNLRHPYAHENWWHEWDVPERLLLFPKQLLIERFKD